VAWFYVYCIVEVDLGEFWCLKPSIDEVFLKRKKHWSRREADPGIYDDLLSVKIREFQGGNHRSFESGLESVDSFLLCLEAS